MELQSWMGICSLWYIDNLTDYPFDLVALGHNIGFVSSRLIHIPIQGLSLDRVGSSSDFLSTTRSVSMDTAAHRIQKI
jgi:hypothetical protein